MKKNRLFALLLAAVMLLGLLAGCGDKPSGGKASSVSLNVVTSYGGDDGNRKNYEDAVKSYEEATGNKIQQFQ